MWIMTLLCLVSLILSEFSVKLRWPILSNVNKVAKCVSTLLPRGKWSNYNYYNNTLFIIESNSGTI